MSLTSQHQHASQIIYQRERTKTKNGKCILDRPPHNTKSSKRRKKNTLTRHGSYPHGSAAQHTPSTQHTAEATETERPRAEGGSSSPNKSTPPAPAHMLAAVVAAVFRQRFGRTFRRLESRPFQALLRSYVARSHQGFEVFPDPN